MKKIRTILLTVAVMIGLAAVPLTPAAVSAQTKPADEISNGVKDIGGGDKGTDELERGIKNVVNVLLFVLGAIAVIMIIIGGIRYATSNGDSGQITTAKNTILYAVIGLIVAILAYAIVNFVLDAFS